MGLESSFRVQEAFACREASASIAAMHGVFGQPVMDPVTETSQFFSGLGFFGYFFLCFFGIFYGFLAFDCKKPVRITRIGLT